ncbi:MAG: 30S ribosomal protein S5 [Nanoarchaeota archaeon]
MKEEILEKVEGIIVPIPEEVVVIEKPLVKTDLDRWTPKTEIGRKVKSKEIQNIDEILRSGGKILESEIIDILVPNLQTDLLLVGQSRGKFGGGKRTIWRQTQKKTSEGNKPKFGIVAIVGNKDGYVGIGLGKSKETMPAREKAIRKAKLSLIRVKRGCGSWVCGCDKNHSIPYSVKGKQGATLIKLMPAPKGTKLCIEKECQKILDLAGIKDVYSKVSDAKTKMNLVYACFDALKNLSKVKVKGKEDE